MAKQGNRFYSLTEIKKYNATYNIIIGERSNGKTYACLLDAVRNYVQNGKHTALVRRWREDFTGKRGQTMFDALVFNGEIAKLTKGEWTGIHYFASKWHLCRYDEETGKTIKDEMPFCYGFSISAMEHDKSTSYPKIDMIIFDEFLTRTGYLPDEFVLFMNVISTIVRHRDNVTIYMLGNTVTKYCPYFTEMGLKHIHQMIPGKIDIYSYGDSPLRVAVELCATDKRGKKSDVYFAFDNPKLNMIKSGAWELDIFPHCPVKYTSKDVKLRFFIDYGNIVHTCEIVDMNAKPFIFIMPKTTELQYRDTDLIYSTDYSIEPNRRRNILKPRIKMEEKILYLFKHDLVYYATNEVGEHIHQYLKWCFANK